MSCTFLLLLAQMEEKGRVVQGEKGGELSQHNKYIINIYISLTLSDPERKKKETLRGGRKRRINLVLSILLISICNETRPTNEKRGGEKGRERKSEGKKEKEGEEEVEHSPIAIFP